MATQHSPADDIVYDLVSVQYHALQAAKAYDSYVADADGHTDVRSFFEECARRMRSARSRATSCWPS